MSKSGQYNYKGINSQAWAAMSLFLQFVRARTLEKIILESPGLQDFVLVFTDGHRIVCESKDYDKPIRHSKIKEILDGLTMNKRLANKDEVLIIASNFSKEVKNDIENYKYWFHTIKPRLQKKGFTNKHFDILSQVRLWEVPPIENHKIVYALFAELLGVWLPQEELEAKVDSLLVKKIYENSAVGGEYSRKELMEEIDKLKENAIKHSGYFDDERIKLESQLSNILQAIENSKSPEWAEGQLKSLTAQPNKMFFITDRFKNKTNLNLAGWDKLWESCTVSFYPSYLFDIFEKNLSTQSNRKYLIDFISRTIPKISSFYRSSFIEVDIVKVCSKIVESDRQLDNKVFDVIKQLIEIDKNDFFYVKTKGDREWEKEKICELLEQLYKVSNKSLKSKIIKLIFGYYNLVEDDGKFWYYTSPPIFAIVKHYIEEDVERRILELIKIAIRQYSEFYKRFGKKLEFDGWELMGGGISQTGSEFSIDDKYFLTRVIKPVLEDYHAKNSEKAWKFIVDNFISRKESKVSKGRPDFLNRAAIDILFKEYAKPKYEKEAFEILSDFIKMRKGIPWKADLIFQRLRGDFTDEQKWALVKVSLDEYKSLPVNIFVEQITSDLAAKGNKEASDTIAEWVMSPEYHKRQTIGSFNVAGNISKFLDNPKTFDKGVVVFKNYISSKEFIEKDNDWETWDIAKMLAKIVSTKPDVGISILKEIIKSKKITLNQQTLICSSINDLQKEDGDLLKKVYQDFVYPFLREFNEDILKIEKKITNRHSREQIVQFAEKLASSRLYEEALYIVKIFVKDSDPIIKNYSDDSKGDFNYHQKIIEGDDNPTLGTVRGYCAWVLQKFCIRYGRDYIAKILSLVEQLTKDPNYYVRVQACIPLIELVKNRHTYLAENQKERFLPVEVAERIEGIAFAMLKNKENHKLKAVMKHLAMVFTYMRTLDEKQAMSVLKTFRDTGIEEVMHEAAPLFIFFAEFRSKSFKDWPWGKLPKFDDKPFKLLLVDLLKNGSPETKSVLSWQFNRLPDEISKTPKEKSQITVDEAITLAVSYFEILVGKYEHRVFENIYRFIEDYVDSYFDACFKLWTKCLEVERPFLIEAAKDKENVPNVYWWPFFYNGKILLAVAKHKGSAEYLKWFDFLADYPVEVLIANDLADAIAPLKKLAKNNKQVERIFDKLIKRNANFLDDKREWQNNNS